MANIAVAVAVLLYSFANGFPTSLRTRASCHQRFSLSNKITFRRENFRLSSVDDKKCIEDAEQLKEKARRYRSDANKLRLSLQLKKIEDLDHEIKEFSSKFSVLNDAERMKRLELYRIQVEDLLTVSVGKEKASQMMSGLSLWSSITSTQNVTAVTDDFKIKSVLAEDDVKSAASLIQLLPMPVQDTLAKTAGYENFASVANMDLFVKQLYENKDKSTLYLRRTYAQSFTEGHSIGSLLNDPDEKYDIVKMSEILVSKLDEKIDSSRAMELFPRALVDVSSNQLPSKEDAEAIFKLLDANTFMATEKPSKVNGGYLIRGVNKRKAPSELLSVLEEKIAKEIPKWQSSFQLNYVEITAEPSSDVLVENAILVTPNEFPVMAPLSLGLIATLLGLISSFWYSINTFGGNEVVIEKLKEASENSAAMASSGLIYDLTWFNDMLMPLLLTLVAVQGLHEVGHFIVAQSNKIKMSIPTILPSLALPYLSFQNRLKTSPKDYNALFDLAFAGPITGLTASLMALLYGLQLTTTVDTPTAKLLPSLSVGFLSTSSLGGTIVDMVLGGDGILLSQDEAVQIPLHPIAIAGFIGLLINALDLLPVGSTDGGRISQATLGRVWHLAFSSLLFFLLFVASFVSDAQGIFLGYLFIYSFTQRDLEIPCRNEVDKVTSPRVIAAVVSWLLAALILVPLR